MDGRRRRRRMLPYWDFLIVVPILMHIANAEIGNSSFHWSADSGMLVNHAEEYLANACPWCDGKGYNLKARKPLEQEMHNPEELELSALYTDASGSFHVTSFKAKDLSDSWVWRTSDSTKDTKPYEDEIKEGLLLHEQESGSDIWNQEIAGKFSHHWHASQSNPVKLKRRLLREERKAKRIAELLQNDEESEKLIQAAAVERSKQLDTMVQGKYSVWRREYSNPNSDSLLKLMKDQVIMAKAYASIARAKKENTLYDSLMTCIKKNRNALGEALSDAELHPSALERAKATGRVLAAAKEKLYDCAEVARKLRAMLQWEEENIAALKKQSTFLTQVSAKTVPKGLHCLPLHLTTDYFLLDSSHEELTSIEKLEDPSLYHYALFSDNVLATSVVVNSTIFNTKEPERHVFHVVTDKLNFAAMKMWFLVNSPPGVTVHVQNVDDFKWLNSSYCPVLRQLETAAMKAYYFKADHPITMSAADTNLKYRNPKYLSMLNHLRFYLPEVFPKLDKILFLDDDIVVQKDLTPLWSVDLKGMVNGAVETCKESFHRFDKYLNFSNPLISNNFDPNACGWAFGMNMFDLTEWKRRNITGIYHYWQNLNEERTLWKLGSLPPGLITFYNLTQPLDRSWHVLGLGYDPALNLTEIEHGAVVHYNGNQKPWLDIAHLKYKSYWSKYVSYDNPYLKECEILV
ncbi:putative galacturonosyltransferase 3 [Nymphaea thermarum]|nr:putative galacturonosyltransferase 3 [Nymphaea thermarum]